MALVGQNRRGVGTLTEQSGIRVCLALVRLVAAWLAFPVTLLITSGWAAVCARTIVILGEKLL